MSTTVIIEGDSELLTRDRRFVCPYCGTIFVAESESYTLATYKEQAEFGVAAFATCPTCSATDAVSPMGSGGEVSTPVALVVKSLPAKRVYKPGEYFDPEGLVLGMVMTDGSIGTVDLADCTFDPDAETELTVEDTEVTVTHTPTTLELTLTIAVRNGIIGRPYIVGPTEFVYVNALLGPDVRGYDPETMTRTGLAKGTVVYDYSLAFTPKDGYCWPDGSTEAVDLSWKIVKAEQTIVTPPLPIEGLVYTGEEQYINTNPVITPWGTARYKFAGSAVFKQTRLKATDAGEYEVIWYGNGTPNCYDTPEYSFKATIAKASPEIELGATELTLTAIATPGEVTADIGVSDGAASVTSSDETVCTASYSNGVVTVTAVADGTATVTISTAATNNCEAASATIAVTVSLA